MHETMRKESALFSLRLCVIPAEIMMTLAGFLLFLEKAGDRASGGPSLLRGESRSEGTSIWGK